jgi:hypothetical protein
VRPDAVAAAGVRRRIAILFRCVALLARVTHSIAAICLCSRTRTRVFTSPGTRVFTSGSARVRTHPRACTARTRTRTRTRGRVRQRRRFRLEESTSLLTPEAKQAHQTQGHTEHAAETNLFPLPAYCTAVQWSVNVGRPVAARNRFVGIEVWLSECYRCVTGSGREPACSRATE